MRVLLLTPPMVQLNTPYPATAYLTGFLRKHAPDVTVTQADPALELFLRLFSRDGLRGVLDALPRRGRKHDAVAHFLDQAPRYLETVDAAIRFLQGHDPSLALRIVGREFLPEGPRFAVLSETGDSDEHLGWAFGALGVQDQAKYLASLYVDDLADVLREGIDPRFEPARRPSTGWRRPWPPRRPWSTPRSTPSPRR
jgi:hypothetical protein